MEWHQKTSDETLADLGTSIRGLTEDAVKDKLGKIGLNKLPEEKTDSIVVVFLRQFQSPVIYLLLVAAVTVGFIGDWIDSSIVGIVLFVNAVIGTIQEGKANKTLAALRKFATTEATVVRDGKELIVADAQLVPGDIVLLKEGDKVPADVRFISVENLKIEESALTGESEPILKQVRPIQKQTILAGEKTNMAFKGTYVVAGFGSAVVVATGHETVIGAISTKLSSVNSNVPFKAHIAHLSKIIVVVSLILSAFVFLIGIIRGEEIVLMFATVVAIAVSIVPEGLPVVVTLVLANGVKRMSENNALVKRLQAVDALGQAHVIAVDKTGTITLNQMMVTKVYVDREIYDVSGEGYSPSGGILHDGTKISYVDHPTILKMGKTIALSADAIVRHDDETKKWNRISGDPTEAALQVFAKKIGYSKDDLLKEYVFIDEIPFESKTKHHSIIVQEQHENVLHVAGAPELILKVSTAYVENGAEVRIDAQKRQELEAASKVFSGQGLRVIGVAYAKIQTTHIDPLALPELILLGFVGISDAIRLEAKDAVKDAQKAGVRVVMITGDHVETAKSIAHQVEIYKPGDAVLTGREINAMDDLELSKKLASVSVFARVSPDHKLRIIEAYRKRGEIVAMTGDGVNDALSLAAADLGVAMGRQGTDVAKEAADIVLLDDNLGSIVSAIKEGRNIYRSIKKVIFYLLSTGLGEVFAIGAALIIGLPIPFSASQIIWLNFVTDSFLVLALVGERGGDGARFSRFERRIVDVSMGIRMFLLGSVMAAGTIIGFVLYLDQGFVKASTVALTLLAVYQWYNAWNARSRSKSIFTMNPFGNVYLVLALILVVGLQIVAVYTPFFWRVLDTVPLSLNDWLFIVIAALPIFVVEELRKFVYRRYTARRLVP